MKRVMTKTAMVAEFQRQDAAAWLELKQAEARYGHEDEYVGTLRHRWATIRNMMEAVGIREDNALPDNQEATRIIIERVRG